MIGFRAGKTVALFVASLAFASVSLAQDVQKQIADAVAVYKQGNMDEALKRFTDMNAKTPKNPDIEAWLGFLYLRTDKGEKAVPLLESAASMRLNDLEILNNLGNAYYATKQFDKALVRYQEVARLNAKMFEPHYNSGNIYLQKKDFVKAIVEFRAAIALKPTDAFSYNNLGVAFESSKDFTNAATNFQKAADLSPTNPTFARNAGLALVRVRKHKDALPYLEHANNTDASVNVALGDVYGKLGKKDLALKAYEAAKSGMSGSATYWFNLGVLRSQNGDAKGAEQAYRKTLELSPNDLDGLNNLGLLMFKAGQYSDAMALFDKLSGLNPSSIAAKINLAASAAKAGELDRAIASWKDILKQEPGRVQIRLDLGNALFEQGDVEGARYHYGQVLLVEKDSSEALNGLGLIHLKGSKLPQAEAAFRSSIASDPKYVPAYNNLAITLERMNRKSQAIAILEKAAKIDPTDPDVKRNLQRLKSEG